MALRVLDGNQTATTLSSVVTGGEHIVAHSVVSLGTTAIANITSAVSGSVVSISNFPASQSTTFGAVTGSVSVLNFPSTQTIAGTVTANPPTYNLLLNTVTAFTFASSGDSPVFSVSQDVGNTWGFSGAFLGGTNNVYKLQEVLGAGGAGGLDVTLYRASDSNITVTTFSSAGPLLVKSGTLPYDNNPNQGDARYFKFVKVSGVAGSSITASVFKASISNYGFPQSIAGTVTVGNSVTIGSLPAISGTVTAAAPNGSLTTRFGTPTTASVAFATSCVTNANRKYLLIQNVTTGSNVITVGIGFTPTTTQGIQLTAGAGITFESSYIPTGAVQILSSVTASNFTILEA